MLAAEIGEGKDMSEAEPTMGAVTEGEQARHAKDENRVKPQRVEVEAPTARAEPSSYTRSSTEDKRDISAPVLKDSSGMPLHAPEALDLLFKLGVLTGEQLGGLLAASSGSVISSDRVGEIMRALGAGRVQRTLKSTSRDGDNKRNKRKQKVNGQPMVASVRRQFSFASANGSAHLRTMYYLTGEGLSYVARQRDLYPTVAESLYRRVLEEARVDHALLRNEFYRRLCEDLYAPARREESTGAPAQLETMWAEAGMTPIRLNDMEGKPRRYLNPDGLLELDYGGRESSGANSLLGIYVESDTGSEDMSWQVAGHADKYAEHFLDLLDQEMGEGQGQASSANLPRVLFVSPGARRTRWLRRVLLQSARDEQSVFHSVREVFKGRGLSLASLFVFTNLELLDEGGPRGVSYSPLSSRELSQLL